MGSLPAEPKTGGVAGVNPEFILVDGRRTKLEHFLARLDELRQEQRRLTREVGKASKWYRKEKQVRRYSVELIKLQQHLERHQMRMLVIFEGRDAAGKGGAIQRITHYMNERHYRVVALGRPTEAQRSQWYFQKYVAQLPRGGEIVIFDRSWYNRAMVEPVFGFCTEKQHENFMQGVVGFERDLVRQGMVLIKFYFSVSKGVQAERFEIRKTNPLKQWKLSEIDLQAQERWADFTRMKYKMLLRSHTADAPWTVVRADSKHRARLNAIKIILNSVDYEGRNPELNYVPDENIVLSGARELEQMRSAGEHE